MKEHSDDLYTIVTKMSAEDRRLFSQFAFYGSKSTQASALFDFFCKAKKFSPDKYEAFVRRKKMEATAASVKSQLKEKLIDWLAYHAKAPGGTGWFQMLAKGELLMRMGLFEESSRYFTTVREEAYKDSQGVYEWLAVSYQSAIIQALNPQQIVESFIEVINRAAEIATQLYDSTTAMNFYMRAISLFYETRSVHKETHRLLVEQLKKDKFYYATDGYLKFEVRIYIYLGRTLINLMLGDLEDAYTENNKLYLDVLQYEPQFILHQPNEYTVCLRDKLYFCFIANKTEEYEELYQPLSEKINVVFKDKHHYIIRVRTVHWLFLIHLNRVGDLQKEMQQFEAHRHTKTYNDEQESHKKEAFMYAGYSYLFLNEFEKARFKFEELVATRLGTVLGDLDNTARFMILICHFAETVTSKKFIITEPAPFLENQAKSFYDYCIKKRLDIPVEKLFITFIKEFAAGGTRPVQKDKLLKILKKIKAATTNSPPYYRMQLAEFNWLAYLEKLIAKTLQ